MEIIDLIINKMFNKVNSYDLALLIKVLIVFMITILPVMIIELCILDFHNTSIYRLFFKRSKSTYTDIFLYLFNVSKLTSIFAILFSFGLGKVIPALIEKYFEYSLILKLNNPILQFLIYFIIYDFLAYWRHRLSHNLPFWWEIHKLHHSATEFNIITKSRVHPFDVALDNIFTCFPLAIIGAPIETYIVIRYFKNIQGSLQHSMLQWDWGWVGKYIFVSPLAHRIHHSAIEEHWDKNMGHVFVLWDKIFGTWYSGNLVNNNVDVHLNKYNKKSFINDILKSYQLFFNKIVFDSKNLALKLFS